MSEIEWQVQVSRQPDDWEGVRADEAVVEPGGALSFYEWSFGHGDGGRRNHVITYGPNAWYTYWRDAAMCKPSDAGGES